jgi:hypothetical protein
LQEALGAAGDLREEAQFLEDQRPGKKGEDEQDAQYDTRNPAGLQKKAAQLARQKKKCQLRNREPPSGNLKFSPESYRSTRSRDGQFNRTHF